MSAPSMSALPWRSAWTLAKRDLSARFKGLRLLLACLFLGVGALAAIGTLTGSIQHELSVRGRTILGGDLSFSVWQRSPTPRELAEMQRFGTTSTSFRLQALAVHGNRSASLSVKAVDSRWPLAGELVLADGRHVGAPPSGVAYLSEGGAARLGLKPGERFTIAGFPLKLGGLIASDPEQLGDGFALGDPVIVPIGMPREAGLTAPGAMFRSETKLDTNGTETDTGGIERLARHFKTTFPDAGYEIRTRDNAAPSTTRFVERMGQFLILVGLAALTIAGIGIGGGVSSYLEARRTSIATLKVLGATSGDIARIYALQVGAAALVGSLAGLLAGVLVTPLLAHALGTLLPVAGGFMISPVALASAAGYGLLVALVFAAPPLVRARSFPAMALMRARVSPLRTSWRALVLPVGLGLAGIVALVMVSAAQPWLSAGFLVGAAAMLGLLALVGKGIALLARRLPRLKSPMLRAGLANLHRPGAQVGALVTALGFGLSAFVLIAGAETSLDAEIRNTVPDRAPDYFVMDLQPEAAPAFRAAVNKAAPGPEVRLVPNLRGRILAYGPADHPTRVDDSAKLPEDAWALRGERGLTWSDTVPPGNVVTAGHWWGPHYAGPPLVSVDEKLAKAVGLKLGDTITIGVLGVERSATIAAFRRIDWDSMGFNFVLVFSPNALEDAPHTLAATISLPPGARRTNLLPTLVQAFPTSSVIETGPLLTQVRGLLDQMASAILAAASVAVLAGLAVLLGAIAAARASRTYDNVILRVLGASRAQLLALQLAEYGVLALVLAVVALGLGSLAGWAVMTQVFGFGWQPDWVRVALVLVAGLVLVMAFALGGSLPLLRAKPAQALREL
ncbi:ABC transporter permease [Novosphingobium sp. 9]|uniref:ABC transporter permease n=1 Tax=Novosphingobium sp. 9 TaxID=2025349 RepID=UPI0021B53EA9|nr:FtsX-like permease family protein [Novosphingobium sp. 9]